MEQSDLLALSPAALTWVTMDLPGVISIMEEFIYISDPISRKIVSMLVYKYYNSTIIKKID